MGERSEYRVRGGGRVEGPVDPELAGGERAKDGVQNASL